MMDDDQTASLKLQSYIWVVFETNLSMMNINWARHEMGYTYTSVAYCQQGLVVINSSPPGQNGRHFGRRHIQMHFREWKVLHFY